MGCIITTHRYLCFLIGFIIVALRNISGPEGLPCFTFEHLKSPITEFPSAALEQRLSSFPRNP
jgi:hypothetical protein